MRQKLSQIHKSIRKEIKQQYFKQRRAQILAYRERQALHSLAHQGSSPNRENCGWRGIFLQRNMLPEEEAFEEKWQRGKSDIDFQITLKTLEEGEYYLNVILEESKIRCLEATIYLLAKLINKILRPIRGLSYLQQKNQANLVYMILAHICNLLQSNMNKGLVIKKYVKSKRYLINLFAEDFKILLRKEDDIIVNQLVNISQIICNQYNLPPNYQLVKFILSSKHNKRSPQNYSPEAQEKVQNLLIKFVILCRIEEKSNLKQMNLPHQQIIYDFSAYIEFSLSNIYDFIRSNGFPFDYEFINDNLSFILTLQIQTINKFRMLCLNDRFHEDEGEYLISEGVISLLEKIAVVRQEKNYCHNSDLDQTAIVLEEAASVILWYLIDSKNQRSKRQAKRALYQCERQGNQILEGSRSILSMIILIKVKLRQLSTSYH